MTTQPTTIVNEAPAELRQRLSVGDVLAQWAQNFGGGIGVAIVAALAAYWLDAPGELTAWVALTAFGLSFGLLMAFRAVVDELLDARAWSEMVADNEALAADLDAACADLDALALQLEDARRDNAMLRFQVEHGAGSKFVAAQPQPSEPAGADVRKMIDVAYSGGDGKPRHPGKETMKGWQWTEKRHAAAYAALRAAGVVTGPDNAPRWPPSKAEALALLTARPTAPDVVE